MTPTHSAAEGTAQNEAIAQDAGSDRLEQPDGGHGSTGELTDEQLEATVGGNVYGVLIPVGGGGK